VEAHNIMAVAVRNMPENTTQTPSQPGSLASSSLIGAVYVIAALIILSMGVPLVWANGVSTWIRTNLGPFVDIAGLIVVEIFVLGVLTMVGLSLVGGTARPGLRAGIFCVVGWIFATLILVAMFAKGTPIGDGFGIVIAAVSLFFGWRFLMGPKYPEKMRQFENQGWFTAATYKPAQGRLVRRATMIGLLSLAGCGVWTLLHHQTLDAMGKDWVIRLPFSGATLTLLRDIRFTVPILLSAVTFWLSYRIIHMPTFAEFLIATEGELNKVAWPTRKSLIQDTIVVLATVIILTVFLFVVDIAWGKILSNPYVGVLKIAPEKKTEKEKDYKELDW
jgi:preprotein translocase subunit SecE